MKRYHPMIGSRAPATSYGAPSSTEIRRTESPHVWLDLTSRDAEFIRHRFPRIYGNLPRLWTSISPRENRPPSIPPRTAPWAVCMSDLEGARHRARPLRRRRRVACTGVHGANRLASNSLLEARRLRTARRAAP